MTAEKNESVQFIDSFGGKRLKLLVDWWHELKNSGVSPSRAEFKLAAWKSHLPWIAAIDLIRNDAGEMTDGIFKVWGSALSEPFGGDVTGQKLSDFGEPYVSRWGAPAQMVEQTRLPVAVAGRVLLPLKDFQRFEIALLPLFDGVGQIDRLLMEAELI